MIHNHRLGVELVLLLLTILSVIYNLKLNCQNSKITNHINYFKDFGSPSIIHIDQKYP